MGRSGEKSDKWPKSEFATDCHIEEAVIAELKPVQALAITMKEIVPRIEMTLDDG